MTIITDFGKDVKAFRKITLWERLNHFLSHGMFGDFAICPKCRARMRTEHRTMFGRYDRCPHCDLTSYTSDY